MPNPEIYLDLKLLPSVDYAHMFVALDAGLVQRLQQLPRLASRAQNAVRFLWHSESSAETLHSTEERASDLRAAFLRAALSELVSIEEILPLDLQELGSKKQVFRLNSSRFGHVHLVRELRNHELHIYHSSLNQIPRKFLWGSLDKPDAAMPFDGNVWVLRDVTLTSLLSVRNAPKRYDKSDLATLVDWFNRTQENWGVQEVCLRAIGAYCEEIADFYGY